MKSNLGNGGDLMQLNEAVSKRLTELLQINQLTPYQLYIKSGVPKSTIGNILDCPYPSMKLRIIHELCQSPMFRKDNLEP